MAKTRQKERTGRRLWQGALTVQRVSALKEELSLAFDEFDTIRIDLSGANEIDPACMQLLCSAHRTALGRKKELSLVGGGHLAGTIREAGFLRHIGCALDCNHNCLWVNPHKAPDSPACKEG